VKSFFEDDAEEEIGIACGEPIRAANVFEMAPEPANRIQPLSNTTSEPSNKRELE
jgi:hypothetical protein